MEIDVAKFVSSKIVKECKRMVDFIHLVLKMSSFTGNYVTERK